MEPPSENALSATITKSFPEVIDKSRPINISLKAPGSYRGGHVFFSEEDVSNITSPFQFFFVKKFSHGQLSMLEINAIFETFSLKSTFNTGLLNTRHILIRFNSKEDYHRVWLQEQWYLKRFLMRIFKWTPNFRVDAESSIAPIWVSLPHLPVHFFSKPNLFFYCKFNGEAYTNGYNNYKSYEAYCSSFMH